MKTKLLYSLLLLAVLSMFSCSKDVNDDPSPDNPSSEKKFSLSNYAFNLTNAKGIAVNNSKLSKSTQVEGGFCIYDNNGQLLPVTLKVSDKFVQIPDSIIPPDKIELRAEVQETTDLGRFMAFQGNFNFISSYGCYYYYTTLVVDKENGNLYDFGGDFPVTYEKSEDGSIYALVRNWAKTPPETVKRITYQNYDFKIDDLLAQKEQANRIHLDKYNNLLYHSGRVRMWNGKIVVLKEQWKWFSAFVAANGKITWISEGVEDGYAKYSFSQLNADGDSEIVLHDEPRITNHSSGQEIITANRGTKSFILEGINVTCFDVSDFSYSILYDRWGWCYIQTITQKFYYAISDEDNKLYRFNFETCEMDTFGEDYQFYDLSPYGENQAQFHGMRFSDGHEVYGIIDENGNINIINDNGDFKSVIIQPL